MTQAGASGAFEIHIGVVSENIGYTVESSWPRLQEWYWKDGHYVIGLSEIEKYIRGKHEIWLTPDASKRFELAFPSGGSEFVVAVKGQPKYGGMFSYPPSAMRIEFPVIYTDRVVERIRFTIRPWHSTYWQGISAGDWNAIKNWNGIDDPEIEEILSRAGKLEP